MEDALERYGMDSLLFAEYRLSAAERVPIKFLSHDSLKIENMMDYILRAIPPKMRIRSFQREMQKLFERSEFIDLPAEDKMKVLEDNYPEFRNWFETVVDGESAWLNAVRREYEIPGYNQIITKISEFFKGEGYVERLGVATRELIDNFKVRKYKIRGKIEGSLENLYDSLTITDRCRQIALVKPLENTVHYKLSNKFGDRVTKAHSQRSIVDIPSRKNRINSYIGMTFSKNKGSNKVVTVFIEEKPAKTTYDPPVLEIVFENLEDADGEVVMRYFLQTFSALTDRGLQLRNEVAKTRFDVFDVELITDMYQREFVRQAFIDLTSKDALRPILFSESSTRVDDQRFCLRDLSGKVKARVDIQDKFVLFTSSKDLFEVLNLVSLFLVYSVDKQGIDILDLGTPVSKWTERVIESQDRRFEMDVVEIKDGERVLRKAWFFDSTFNKVCNKPENIPAFGAALKNLEDPNLRIDYFPPASIIKKLTESGQYEFPRYQTQRIPIQTYYGDVLKGKKTDKVRILGKRRIPRDRRDEMAAVDNMAYIFGYFPCVVTIRKKDYEDRIGEDIMDDDEDADGDEGGEETGTMEGGEHIYNDVKDEIPFGRLAKTQLHFFDSLKTNPNETEILRTGVPEGPNSLFVAANIATGGDIGKSINALVRDLERNPLILQAGISQFPDSKLSEIQEFVVQSTKDFMDSKYLVNIIGEFLEHNIIVLEYNEDGRGGALDYAFYECPRGTVPPNIFEQLNMGRRTVVLLRRKYQSIYDQYDFLVERNRSTLEISTTFDTKRVKEFLQGRVAFVDMIPDIITRGEVTRIVDLSKKHFMIAPDDPLREVAQVIDSTGSRIGTLFRTENADYPVVHATPLTPSAGLPVIGFINLLSIPRPSIQTISIDLGVLQFDGVGRTVTNKMSFVSSVLVEGLIFLCLPEIINDTLEKLFAGSTEIETPDPYIIRQFINVSSVPPETVLLKIRFIEIVSHFILQVMFLEILERFVEKNTFDRRSYREWRRSFLTKDSTKAPDSESVSLTACLMAVGEVKSLGGFIPPSPISWLKKHEEDYSGLAAFFTNQGGLRCFSKEMFEKMDSQITLLERIIPTMNIRTRIPLRVYKIKGLYDTLVAMSQSPESVTGLSYPGDDSYQRWQDRCKTTLENTNVYEGIYKPFFTISKDQPVIGFHGNRGGSGLWVIRPVPLPDGGSQEPKPAYPVFGNTLPRITYIKETSLDVFNPEDPNNKLRMEKLV
jgi:hypothetical protein